MDWFLYDRDLRYEGVNQLWGLKSNVNNLKTGVWVKCFQKKSEVELTEFYKSSKINKYFGLEGQIW